MSSNDRNNSRDSPTAPHRRRSSFVDMFNPRASISSQSQPSGPRRLSITTLGLSTLPGAQTSPFNNIRNRAESVSSANSGSVDESPFEDDMSASPSQNNTSVPATPFGRRMSFGAARSLRGPSNGSSQNGTAASSSNEGFDFAEQMRQRAERSSISSGVSGLTSPQSTQPAVHHRSKSVAIMEPPKSELPKQTRPDAFQERILKGDFYMD